jgi:uncharacterized protein DUF262
VKRTVEPWSIEKLHKARTKISFPEYQRQPKLWTDERKQLLIDSILRDIDIPKLYFNRLKGGHVEVIDGQQRLWAIWEFLDNAYSYELGGRNETFASLPPTEQKRILKYELQVTVFEDADDDYLRELFLRLQLGLLLVTGEKLHATTGVMKDFVFDTLVNKEFIRAIDIPKRRYAKETLCAQIAINSFSRARTKSFCRTRGEDLLIFFRDYAQPQGTDLVFFRDQSKAVRKTIERLWDSFQDRAENLTNRSFILSVYFLFEELESTLDSADTRNRFVKFVFALWERLREEVDAGIDRKNRELYAFETMLSSAPGERYQIERRHDKLVEYYSHYVKTRKILGDK